MECTVCVCMLVRVILPDDVFRGLVVHAVLDVFHLFGEYGMIASLEQAGKKASDRGIRSGRDGGNVSLIVALEHRSPPAGLLCLGAVCSEKMELCLGIESERVMPPPDLRI